MISVVVTGTGTDVGKTFVTAGLLRLLLRSGRDAVAQKPFQTGCGRLADGTLGRPDLDRIAAMSGWDPRAEDMKDLCPYAYEPACSPHLAARMAGDVPGGGSVVNAARRLAQRHETVLCETAGGVRVPINDRECMLDWMAALGWPVVVVARAGLGTLNETLLTLQALRDVGLECAGVALNQSRAPAGDSGLEELIRSDNAETILQLGRVPVIVRIPFLGAAPGGVDCTALGVFLEPLFHSIWNDGMR